MTNSPEPNSTINLSCPCGRTWTSNILSGVSLAEWVAHLETQACPGCGVGYRVTSQGEAK